jgi:hypothetical protein
MKSQFASKNEMDNLLERIEKVEQNKVDCDTFDEEINYLKGLISSA